MRFKASTIQPGGRLSYGHYLSSGNITNSVVRTSYYGDGTTNTIGEQPGTGQEDDLSNFYMFLSKESGTYNAQLLSVSSITDNIQVIGYRQNMPVPTLVMNLDTCNPQFDESGEATTLECPENYGISGISESGMTIAVQNNGTSATTIQLTLSSAITASQGEIIIPCNIYLSTANMFSENETLSDDDMIIKWYNRKDSCRRVDFKFSWRLEGGDAASVYTLDLSNEVASVNCDSAGTVLHGAVVLPRCDATLYFGTEVVSGATWSISINEQYHCTGVGIVPNGTGATLTFDTANDLFQFSGNTTPLAIEVVAQYLGSVTKKTMTVYKNLAGADGTLPVSRWLVPSANQIVYDRNTETVSPETIRCACWAQVGGDPPAEDTETIIYWKYEGDNSWTSSEDEDPRSGITNIDYTKSMLIFALMNARAEIYESETVPILKNGLDGTGSSPYRLDLSNQNASINCDSGGTILNGAIRPECKATLYYGENEVEMGGSNYYGITIPSRFRCSGVSINSETGVITFASSAATGNNKLYWSGTTLQITVDAYSGATRRGRAIMNVSKNLAGANGQDAVTYWLAPTANAIQVTSGGTPYPASVSCQAWKQVGEHAPVMLSSSQTPKIYSGYNTDNPSAIYTNGSAVAIDTTKNFLTFQLWDNNTQYDIETIPIVKDGQDGSSGQGRAGAAIRGPVDWYSGITANRRFCNGVGPNESDKDFIDILFKDGDYYRCTTSYDGGPNDNWNAVKSNWTITDASYDFVASQLLLAQNAKINFYTGNEIYLMDDQGHVTAGAAAGSGITFWAGSDTPSEGNFQVDYNGNITAKSGTFSGYIRMPYSFVSDLTTGTTNLSGIGGYSSHRTYLADDRAYLISDSGNTFATGSLYSALRLPKPSSGIDGMMYEIIVEQPISLSGMSSIILVTMSGNSYNNSTSRASNTDFVSLAFCERYYGDWCVLYGGRYQFTCIPHRSGNLSKTYTWAITMANGQFLLGRRSDGDMLLSPTFSLDRNANTAIVSSTTLNTITKIVQYTGTRPTMEQNSDKTLYVSRD